MGMWSLNIVSSRFQREIFYFLFQQFILKKKVIASMCMIYKSTQYNFTFYTLLFLLGSGKKGSRPGSSRSKSPKDKDKKRDKSGSPKRGSGKKSDTGSAKKSSRSE